MLDEKSATATTTAGSAQEAQRIEGRGTTTQIETAVATVTAATSAAAGEGEVNDVTRSTLVARAVRSSVRTVRTVRTMGSVVGTVVNRTTVIGNLSGYHCACLRVKNLNSS